jgi:hypothetical protein
MRDLIYVFVIPQRIHEIDGPLQFNGGISVDIESIIHTVRHTMGH